jgi:fucose permease
VIAVGVVTGLGAGGIDAAINAHAAVNFSPRVVSWLHASYGVGAALGPLVMTAALTGSLGWRWGYGLIAAALTAVTLCFALTGTLWRTGQDSGDGAATGPAPDSVAAEPGPRAREPMGRAPRGQEAQNNEVAPHSTPAVETVTLGSGGGPLATLGRPVVLAGAALFFVYTGLEATAGQWTYSLFTESRGISQAMAGTWASAFWASLTAGRVLAGVLAARVAARALLRASMAGAPLGSLAIWLLPGPAASLAALVLIGLSLAPVYPLLTSETPGRLGGDGIAHAIGFQVAAAYLGTAALPGAAGWLARWFGLEMIGPFMLIAALALLALHEWTLRLARSEVRRGSQSHVPFGSAGRQGAWRSRIRS